MPAIKALVIGLGVLLLTGVALLIYGISQKAADPKFKLLEGKPPVGAPLASFGETSFALPEHCEVAEIRPDGPRLYLRTGPSGACERILVIDTASGQLLGSIRLRP
ncbi:MAG: hypothetical protein U1E42_01340 [Rhodospirillales bacterium]